MLNRGLSLYAIEMQSLMVYNLTMRIGIYGGAFDPIHKEHKKIIHECKNKLKLDRLILLLSHNPPHKNYQISPFEIRAQMLKAETCDLDYVIVDEREYLRSASKNRSFEVLSELKNEYTAHDLIYIIGGDSMIKFHTWARPEIIARLMPIAVIPREGYEGLQEAVENARKVYGARIKTLSFKGGQVSSSVIKATYEFGDRSGDVSDKVHDIIIRNNLYKQFGFYIDKLKANISQELFEHCKSTALYALRFADKLDLSYDEVFLAALLHDCAKEKTVAAEYAERYPEKIIHQFEGAVVAQKEYGIDNPKILNAIKYHTTGKMNMSKLEKLIFSADMLEKNRDFEGVERLREIMEEDFEKGFLACVDTSIKRLEDTGRAIYYLTKECRDFYKNPQK